MLMLIMALILAAGSFAVLTGLILLIVWVVRSKGPKASGAGTGVHSRSRSSDDTWMYASGAAGVSDTIQSPSGTPTEDEGRRHVVEAVAAVGAMQGMAAEPATEVSGSHCGGAFDSGSVSSDSGSSCSSDSGSSSTSSSGD
jgi:hypothetical protein